MTRGHTGAPRGDGGFTLIEVIVSLALLALILAMMPGTFRLGHRAWEVTGELDRSADDAAVRSFLEQRLSEALQVYEPTSVGFVRVAFRGLPDSVTFVAPAPSGSRGGGLYQYRIDVHTGPGAFAPALWLQQSLYHLGTGANENESADQRLLFAGIAGVSFRYFGRKEKNADPEWHSEWARTDTLPELIEISFEGRGGTRSPMQPLVVELKLRV